MDLGCYAYLGPTASLIKVQAGSITVASDVFDEFFQLGALIIVLGDKGQGGFFRINIYFVVDPVSSNVALQFGVQIGFGNVPHLIVICQTCGGGVASDGPHHLGFGLGLRAGRAAATAAGGQEQKGQCTGQKQGSQLSQFCHVGRLQSFLFW